MLLGCPSCHATFRVPAGAVKDTGRVVRCAKCKHEWKAFPQDLIPEVTAESALKAADAIEKKLHQEEIQRQRHEVEELLSIKPASAPVEAKMPPATASAPMDFANVIAFDFDSVESAAPTTETENQEDDFAAIQTDTQEEPQEEPAEEQDVEMDALEAALSAQNTFEETEETQAEDETSEDTSSETEISEQEQEQEAEEAYQVTEDEMQAFASLVSQEELDAIPTAENAQEGDGEESLDVIEARLAIMEAAQPKTNKVAKPKTTGKEKIKKTSAISTLWLSLTFTACVLLCVSTAFVTQQEFLRNHFPVFDKLYNSIGLNSSKGLELEKITFKKNKIGDTFSYDLSGAIKNNRTGYAAVPPVRIRLVDTDGKTMRSWDFAQDKKMEPNESVTFNAPKLKVLTGTEGTPEAFVIDIGNSLEMLERK